MSDVGSLPQSLRPRFLFAQIKAIRNLFSELRVARRAHSAWATISSTLLSKSSLRFIRASSRCATRA